MSRAPDTGSSREAEEVRRDDGARRGGPVRAAALVADRAIERVLGRGRSRPILVLGAPRSGTTLVAQFLIAALDVGFLSNRERAGWRTPCLSIRRHRAASRFAPSFTSERGVVPGADAPSDGWELFRLCCGAELGDPAADPARLARILRVAERTYGVPILVKNNANGVRVPALRRALPGATFVVVRRDPAAVARSVLAVFERLGVERDFWACGVGRDRIAAGLSAEWNARLDDPLERAVFQQLFVEAFTARALAGAGSLEIGYERFCEAPAATVDELLAIRPDLRRRSGVALPEGFAARPVEDPAFGARVALAIDAWRDVVADPVQSGS